MTSVSNTVERKRPRVKLSPPIIALLLALLLFLVGGVINPDFLNADQAINIVRLAAFLGIIAAGQTLVIISGGEGIDLSVGAIVTLGAIIVFRVSNGQNSLIVVGFLAAMGVGAFIGLLNGIGITWLKVPPLVMTLAMAGVVQGIILIVSQGTFEGKAPSLLSDLISNPLIGIVPGVLFIWALLALGMWLLLERSVYGKQLFAVGVNRLTARLSGVNVPRTIIVTYALSGMLAAFGGAILLGFTQTVYFNLGVPYLFPSIAAVVVGGTLLSGGVGSYWGTMSGALVLTLISSLLRSMQLPEAYQLVILGIILLALISVYGRQRSLRQ
ncbi:ABC transporter permease [Candidatus Leptofilum sp.]|uniref:ABC transporter permease n=1 Tax=Candidatus Leptofilum sp. TaxID=3241576 RepID=UPI003B5960D0